MEKDLSIKKNFEFALKNHQENNLKVAEKFYKKVLEINPNHFESTFLLGTLSAQIKNFDLAKQLLLKTIQINPNYADAHNNLGNVLTELKEFEKAKSCYKKAIQINPNYADAHNNLGVALQNSEEYEESINYYKKVIQINPNYADAHNNLGVALKELGEHQKAISCYKKAIQIQPNHASAHYNLGIVFRELNDFKNAISFYEKAIQIKSNYSEAHHGCGSVFRDLGDFQKAINSFEQATKSQPDNLAYLYPLSDLKKEILNPNFRNKIENIIKNDNATKRNMAFGNYLLAKYEHKIKNYEKEIDYLIKGHTYYFQLKKKRFTRQLKYWLDVLPNISKQINLNKLDKNINQNIIGVPRCGSTMVEKIIASSTKYIPIGEETGIIEMLIKDQIEKKQLLKTKMKDFQLKIIEKYNQKGLIQEKSDYTFTDKSLDNFFYIGLIKEIFPNAKVINCKRNALSSIMSILQNNLIALAWAHDIEYIFKYFDIYYQMIEDYKKIFPNFIYELQYEKFVNSPEIESKKLLKFCGLPWDKKCLEFYKRKDIVCKTTSNIQIRDPIYKNTLDKYEPYKKFLDKYGNKYPWFN